MVASKQPIRPIERPDRRGFPRVGITERVKIQRVDKPGGSLVTFGSTVGISRGGLEAVVQGAPIPTGARCVVRFLSTSRIKPSMSWGKVVGVSQGPYGRTVRIEFETPLERLNLSESRTGRESDRPTVLVVDDELPVCDVIRRFLTRRGYRVEVQRDGEGALQSMRREVPDVALLDIYMPKLDGLDLLARMREEGLTPSVVIAISGAAGHEPARRALALGADDFLVKPIDLNYLSWAIRLRL